MKISIDVSSVIYGTGVSVYTKNLVNNLVKIDKQNDYLLFGGSLRRFEELKYAFNTKFEHKYYYLPPLAMNYLFNYINIPVNLLTGKVDIYHSSDWTQPVANCPVVTTVHDLSPLKYPRYTPARVVRTHQVKLERAKKMASKIIAVSNSTKNDLIEMGFDKDKIVVISEAADPLPIVTQADQQKILFKYSLKKGDYILNVGTNPRKNNENIANAFETLNKKGIVEKFVVTGNIPQKKINNINYLGFVSDLELAVLYKNATCLVYASLYEGFGIPVLQAFEANCPVVTSNISSLPEVAGYAAILVNPREPDDIAEGIIKAIKDRTSLSKRGHAQASKFTWKKCAKQTLSVYNSLK